MASAATAVAFEPAALPAVSVSSAPLAQWSGDLLVLGVHEDALQTESEVTTIKSEKLSELDGALGGALAEIVSVGGFEGKQGSQSRVVRLGSTTGSGAKYLGLVGLGKAAGASAAPAWGVSPYQALGTAVAALAKAQKATSVAVAFVDAPDAAVHATAVAQIASGALLGGYESTRFKSKKSPTVTRLGSLEVLLPGAGEAATAALAHAQAVASGTFLTKYLVEAPPNICTPTHIAESAQHIANAYPDVMALKVYEKADCQAMGMGSFLGVAEASDEPPKLIHLKYTPAGGATRKVAIVGKGLTFDSGGYNIKAGPGSMIELMKFDMGGAACTFGAARIIAALQPAGVEIHFISASCENMVAGRGLRPGDILTAASGKTIEVNNTDAEGRLTLADAMWFAQEKCGAQSMVDVATLTGACIVALGTEIAGLFTPSDAMAASISEAAKATGEKVWRMPMEANYFEQLKSPVADMRNTGSRSGGSITAALFLKQFVNEGVEWAHLDIAGPVWDEKLGLPTGYGAALLAQWATSQGQAKQ